LAKTLATLIDLTIPDRSCYGAESIWDSSWLSSEFLSSTSFLSRMAKILALLAVLTMPGRSF